MTGASRGILAVGCYLPRHRLPKSVVTAANGWYAPSLRATKGERRTFANWDEDALTMAVEAGRACLGSDLAGDVSSVDLVSTSLPFADRSNAGVVREALDVPDTARVVDSGGSLRAASTALLRAFAAGGGPELVVAADCVDAKPASPQELQFGHGAAAVLVGEGDMLARPLGSVHLHQDFVDHYRAAGERFEYALESRWARDAGYRGQVARTLARALERADVAADAVTLLAVSAPGGLAMAVTRMLGKTLSNARSDSLLTSDVGFCGAAEPLMALCGALEQAEPGERMVLVALGQGIDVVVLEVLRPVTRQSLVDAVSGGLDEDNYARYLALRGLLPLETGIRAERDERTAMSAFWRKHDAVTAFKGGQCEHCDTLQFPATRVCVNCGREGTQALRRMADLPGTVRSFTEDWLAYTPRPPLVFGNVGFTNGANILMEFTDIEPGELVVGAPVRMRFRIKDIDARRAFRRYFWKPTVEREQTSA
jgi:hydroxymethylglutaryl-CoA synthase